MRIEIAKNYQQLSESVATIIIDLVKVKPNCVICLASGDTLKLALRKVLAHATEQQIDFSAVQFIGLDEWVGISADTHGSCAQFFREYILTPLGIPHSNFHLFDGTAIDLEKECEKMDEKILGLGGIDLMVVGIGINGHVGFNEPGIPTPLKSHVAELHETTKSIGQKYFKTPTSLKKGITLGLQHLLDSQEVILVASGEAKASVIQKTILGEISEEVPATVVRKHPHSLILIDEEAASAIAEEERIRFNH
jgi:glucosamine-6-phosphate isomerase